MDEKKYLKNIVDKPWK